MHPLSTPQFYASHDAPSAASRPQCLQMHEAIQVTGKGKVEWLNFAPTSLQAVSNPPGLIFLWPLHPPSPISRTGIEGHKGIFILLPRGPVCVQTSARAPGRLPREVHNRREGTPSRYSDDSDTEIRRQQRNTRSLERELAHLQMKGQDSAGVNLVGEEAERYEDEISDRLRRLQRYEETARFEEERRKAERRYRLQRLEAAETEAAEQEEFKARLKHKRPCEVAAKD
ncbi:hypothetical protein BJX65DRAFT_309042 [Aspergillus insuetus]